MRVLSSGGLLYIVKFFTVRIALPGKKHHPAGVLDGAETVVSMSPHDFRYVVWQLDEDSYMLSKIKKSLSLPREQYRSRKSLFPLC